MTDIKRADQDTSMQWLMQDEDKTTAGLSLAKMTIRSGTTSELHFHPN